MISIKADTWTRIDIPVEQFNNTAFGVWNVIVGETVMYSMMWADKPAKLVQPIIAQIEELPDGTSEFDYMAIDALPEAYRTNEYITNLYKFENSKET